MSIILKNNALKLEHFFIKEMNFIKQKYHEAHSKFYSKAIIGSLDILFDSKNLNKSTKYNQKLNILDIKS